ncbi:MAG: CCA tRNA nucleotidyltransferase [Alphaproteobacteria bacterium]|nr:CCA tRNA nucleotidyltransferase [Alphaproteobacteria bacterium]
MIESAARKVLAALQADGATVRFVGGCVRDAILGQEAKDIDLATPDAPETVIALLKRAGLGAVPTGIKHGTVTAIADHRHVEVTTLRRDVATDGRHATVEFTDDWAADAARRDFTFNALFADPDGTIYDPTGGLPDLSAGRVRFVGDPRQRVAEDYLRILRFFRFFAFYGRTALDEGALKACSEAAPHLEQLSAERIAGELLRLLSAPNPLPALSMMGAVGVLQVILPEATRLEVVGRLREIEVSTEFDPDPLLRLAALIAVPAQSGTALAENFAHRLRLSTEQRRALTQMLDPPIAIIPGMPDCDVRAALYRTRHALFAALVFLAWARAGGANDDFMRYLTLAARFDVPVLPLSGADIRRAGVDQGPEIGKLLGAVESWWIAGDFAADRQACLRKLRTLVQNRSRGGVLVERASPRTSGPRGRRR